MGGRQLLLDTILKRRTDCVPVSPFIYNNVVNEKFDDEPADPIEARAQLYRKYGFNILATSDYISEGTPEENLYAFAQTARDF